MPGLHVKVVDEAAPDDCFVVHFTAVPQDIRDFLDGLMPTAAA